MRQAALPHRTARLLAAALVAVLAAGCADFPIVDKTPSRSGGHPKAVKAVERDTSPPRESPSRAKERDRDDDTRDARDAALKDGIRMYNEGDFNGAIKRLSGRELANGPLAPRLEALKYTAFSYCVTSRPAQCRQAFDKALRLDPDFDLAPGEHGHPLWGPVFTKARQAVAQR